MNQNFRKLFLTKSKIRANPDDPFSPRLTKILLPLLLVATSIFAQESQSNAAGALSFEIRDAASDALIPAKLVFLQGDTVIDLGVKSQGLVASRKNTIYTANGQGSVKIPVGEYTVWAGRGVEYSAHVQKITINPEGQHHLIAKIKREVDTRGYAGGDMHLHTLTYSGHGDAQVDERIISCLGEGLEWAVATDHNHVTDYAPMSKQLGAGGRMLTSVGNEISTPIGHFNAYPLPPKSEKTDATLKDAKALFKLIRSVSENVVIQINHPRWPGGDYYTILDFDQTFGLSNNRNWSWDFDAFELLNENRGLGWIAEEGSPISVRQDWFNMLNHGWKFTAVGNSDSHDVLDILAGMPRNYIASSTDDPAQLDEAELVRNIKNRHVSVNRGLFVEFGATDGGRIGEQVTAKNGVVSFNIRVQAPSWVDCDTVQMIGNGKVVATFVVDETANPVRFERTITVRPQFDTWYVAVATGSKSMAPLIHDAPAPITPLGFTNPIWVDADGDGKFMSLYNRAGLLVQEQAADPTAFVAAVAKRPDLRKFAVSFLAQNDVPHKANLFTALLPTAALRERLFVFDQLSRIGDEVAKASLRKAAAHSGTPVEKFAIAVARVKADEKDQWPLVVDNVARVADSLYLRKTLQTLSAGNYLRQWFLAAPFPFKKNHGLDTVFPPERDWKLSSTYQTGKNTTLRWQQFTALQSGMVDLVQIYGENERVNAYAHTEFQSEAGGNMLFLLGSDDGVAVWLNGKEVHRHHVHRGVEAGEDFVVAPVRKGKNTLLVKVENGGGGWGFCIEPVDVLGWLGKQRQ